MTIPKRATTVLDIRTLDELQIEDEPSFRHVGLYADLKQVVRRAALPFRILPANGTASWDRALLLNLTFWQSNGEGDVLVDDSISADVVTHVAWHHLASKALAVPVGAVPGGAAPAVSALFMGEAIASAFDLYLVGRLLGHAPDSTFLETQVPAMKDVAEAAGVPDQEFEALLNDVVARPERAFADLRALLFDACMALHACADADDAYQALSKLDSHRLAPLLHRYELSTWILHARAFGARGVSDGRRDIPRPVHDLDKVLREHADPVDWLWKAWVIPALG